MPSLEFLAKIKKLAIVAMFSDDDLMNRLVLKGGNLLDMVYDISTRASLDLDFSIDGEFEEIEVYRQKIENSLRSTFAEAGFVAFDIHFRDEPPNLTDDMRGFWGGYKVDFKIIDKQRYESLKDDLSALRRYAEAVGAHGSTKFTIDISRHEYCREKRARTLDDYTIYVYSREMIICEKLRAICQQMPEYAGQVRSYPSARARDFVDIHTVAERYGIEFGSAAFAQLVRNVFAVKRVPLRLIGRIRAYREYHRADFPAVKDTVKAHVQLRDFDYYFDYVVEKCCRLEPLWNE